MSFTLDRTPATTTSPAGSAPAASARHATKVYGSGETRVVALDDVDVDFASRPVHRHHGPLGIRQVDADALHGRARPVDPGRRSSATSTSPR